jgi:hypothetical protein
VLVVQRNIRYKRRKDFEHLLFLSLVLGNLIRGFK